VTVAGAAPEPSPELLDAWISRLDVLEARLADERLEELLVWRPLPGLLLVDGVSEQALRRDRDGLRERIAEGRHHYEALRARTETTR